MTDIKEEIKDYIEDFKTAAPDYQDILRSTALQYFWKWEEIRNQIRAIDMEAD